ncbi:MAG: response regulator, partial [Nitrospirota bacterium]
DALRKAYAAQLPDRIQQIEAMWETLRDRHEWNKKEFGEFRAAIHSLAGSSGTFGYMSLGKEAGRLNMFLHQIMERDKAPEDDQKVRIAAHVELLKHFAEDVEKITASPENAGVPVKQMHNDREGLIFLVEDDPLMRQGLASQIGYYGYTVHSFSRPGEIKEALKGNAPSAIIMDVMFPESGLAGIETIAELKKSSNIQSPVIFITARDDMSARLEAVRVGAKSYLTKPLDVRTLINRLDELTKRENEPFRVLVVDDEPDVAEQHALILRQAGMTVETVTDPMKVVTFLSRFLPDLILMDIYMPECSGLELTSVIRQYEEYLSVPLLFLSVESDLEKHLDAMLCGGDHFLVKPVMPGQLIFTVTVLADRYRKLRSLMKRDRMTGLLNHTATVEQLKIEIERSKRRGSGLVFGMIDLDNFKSVNDAYGHPSGDHVLKSLSMLLQQRLRKTDITGRYGREEFAFILIDTDIASAMKTIEDIRERFAMIRHKSDDGQEFSLTLSCGVAAFPEYKDADTLINAADKGLYDAKKIGRNRIVKG